MKNRNLPSVIRSRAAAWFVLAAILVGAGSPVAADTLILKSGRSLSGRVISETDESVTFEWSIDGSTIRTTYPRSRIDKVEREVREGPSFYPLPIIGSIGQDLNAKYFVTAQSFRTALNQVLRAKPDYIILVIDSPGGSVEEMSSIVQAIHSVKNGPKFIAYIKKDALSAAAIIAVACETIIVSPNARIGAAVPYQVGPDGTPQNIEEKFQSAVRADFRNAALQSGHSPLLIQAMMETDIEIAGKVVDGKVKIVESTGAADEIIIKRRGEILTLTGKEATKYGLATGQATSFDGMRQVIDLEAWHQEDDRAWHQMLSHASSIRDRQARKEREAVEHAIRVAEQQEQHHQRQRIQSELQAIDSQLGKLQAIIDAATDTENDLINQFNSDMALAEQNYQYDLSQARLSDSPSYWSRQATIHYDQTVAGIQSRIEPQLNVVRQQMRETIYVAQQLQAEQQALVRAMPRGR